MIPRKPGRSGHCIGVRVRYRMAFGPRAGHKVLTLQGALPREISGKQKLCANLQGFSLHAEVRDGLSTTGRAEKDLGAAVSLHCPPSARQWRVQCNAAGQVELIKCPWRDGTTHQVMSFRMDYPVVKKNVISLGCCLAAIHRFPGLDLHFGFACCRLI